MTSHPGTFSDELVAALAGRYELVREVGRGGMATVYLARDLAHDRDVAIKVMHAELSASMGADRFLPRNPAGRKAPRTPASSRSSTPARWETCSTASCRS